MKTDKQHKLDTNKIYIFNEAKNKWVGYDTLEEAFSIMLGIPYPPKNGS